MPESQYAIRCRHLPKQRRYRIRRAASDVAFGDNQRADRSSLKLIINAIAASVFIRAHLYVTRPSTSAESENIIINNNA